MSAKQTFRSEPGARWLRCDLHVHTPFDGEKKFGENVRHAIEAFKKEKPQRLAGIAEGFVDACRAAADGEGMDLVALTDHNSIDGYRYLKPQFDTLAQQAVDQGLMMPAILPGVEFSVGGERPIHFLIIFSSGTCPEDIDNVIRHVFTPREPFDFKTGTPKATGRSVTDFLDRLYEYCRPDTGERDLRFVLLPAHADGSRGVAKETGAYDTRGLGGLMDEMKGHLRQWVVTRRDWHGFETAHPFGRLSQVFQDLLLSWEAARRGDDWDLLKKRDRDRYRYQEHWPLVECSDPHNYENIGTRFSWLKMEVPDIEGIRIALLDPESRLRRMADGPPIRTHARFQRIRIEGTDFFEDIEIPINPCLTTLIGGRGTGKSTVIEYLRHAVGRDRGEDFPRDESANVRTAVQSVLATKREQDFGYTKGTLLPNYQITVDIVVAERLYQICRSSSGVDVVSGPDQQNPQSTPLDVRSLVLPRILSQRQIAQIARDPASQRHELDALIDPDSLREIEERRHTLVETLTKHQALRTRLTTSRAKLPSVNTELQKVRDQISFLESGGRKEGWARFDAMESERRWLEDAAKEIQRLASELDDLAEGIGKPGVEARDLPSLKSEGTWLRSVADRILASREAAARTFRDQAQALRSLHKKILSERKEQWQPDYDLARATYETLIDEMKSRGVAPTEHEKLLQRRAHLQREKASLQKTSQELEQVEKTIRDIQLELIDAHGSRFGARKEQAQALEEMDADVRLDLLAFRDRDDFESRREQWFGGAGLQERDWVVLCDYVFGSNGEVPDRLRKLVKALRTDIKASSDCGAAIDADESNVASLLGQDRLTKYFYNALVRSDRIRIGEMERFLPEDLVQAKVRTTEGRFKTIETGSVGEKSTAVLSLLLSAGDQPIIIDQPEDDLDNQYVYNVVVDLVRRRKFNRQVIIATHNANIPVNGDAELIVALGADNRRGKVLGAGSIDRPKVKDLVARIMEGSAEAFRRRRERYGY